MSAEPPPIFIRGFSRSGGTLVVTILDAHPLISMSYELYPHLLLLEDDGVVSPAALTQLLKAKRAKAIKDKNIKTFATRCERSGVMLETLSELVQIHAAAGDDFSDQCARLRFV